MALYHERWEHEVTYLALRHTLLQGRVLRSGDPAGVQQEMWALLAVYQALRIAVTDAVQSVPGTDPDRTSWQIAVETAQDLLPPPQHHRPGGDLTGDIGRAVLARLNPPPPRVCAAVKSPLSRGKHRRQPHTKRITAHRELAASHTTRDAPGDNAAVNSPA